MSQTSSRIEARKVIDTCKLAALAAPGLLDGPDIGALEIVEQD
jgi:hypothetical protein